MSLKWISETIKELGVTITTKGENLQLSDPASKSPELVEAVEFHKYELLAIHQGKMVRDVGNCDQCVDKLVGLLAFDGYINRTCPTCGKWFRCLPPLTKETTPINEIPLSIQQSFMAAEGVPFSTV